MHPQAIKTKLIQRKSALFYLSFFLLYADINIDIGLQVLGYTALHTAADHDHMASVKLLVERKADINLQRMVPKSHDDPIDHAA